MNKKDMSIIDDLKEISNRGKVAFAIFCLESAVDFFQLDKKRWQFVFNELWKFCSSDMGLWQERLGEVIPFVVCEKIDFKVKEYQYLTNEEHDELQDLYEGTSSEILKMIGLIFELGRKNLFVSIRDERTKSAAVPFLQSIIEIMHKNNIPLPDIKLFKQFAVTENSGWGREFTREDIFK